MKDLITKDNLEKIINFIKECLFFSYNAQDATIIIENIERKELLRFPASKFLTEAEALLKAINEMTVCARFSTQEEIQAFMDKIHCISSSPCPSDKVDIHIILHDQRSNMNSNVGFSIRSQLGGDSTLLNASGENTNFIYEISGPMDDKKMEIFNNIFKKTRRKGRICYDIATSERMQFLQDIGCDLSFVNTAKPLARENLIKCGGKEMPIIVAGMLKKFYFENLSGSTSMEDCIEYLSENDVAEYEFDDLKQTYHGKIAHLLLCTFTGMRLGSKWNGRQEVNGGYIVVKNNGDVVAFHSTIADEFKDFLVAKMLMERPSHSRHKDMVIYKEGDKYFIKLSLQLRFSLNR